MQDLSCLDSLLNIILVDCANFGLMHADCLKFRYSRDTLKDKDFILFGIEYRSNLTTYVTIWTLSEPADRPYESSLTRNWFSSIFYKYPNVEIIYDGCLSFFLQVSRRYINRGFDNVELIIGKNRSVEVACSNENDQDVRYFRYSNLQDLAMFIGY
ncbi:MAG: hypothetical protein GY861_21580 [bacterium]|nr:hypothetical protein [bacterium]